uniref:LITAF domain-containing protein n=1 Tax=Oryzias latipes TaxID=8090 RepID=A0A3P9L1K8_ORYLA
MYNQNPPPYSDADPGMIAPVYPPGFQNGKHRFRYQRYHPCNYLVSDRYPNTHYHLPLIYISLKIKLFNSIEIHFFNALLLIFPFIVTQVTAPLRDTPGVTFCVYCQKNVLTRTSFEIGAMAWVFCGGITLCWPCMLLPFCLDSCKDVKHYCPSCNNLLHFYRRM